MAVLIEDSDVDQFSRARVGSTLDEKWNLESLLGVGGMAAVYSARHRNGARAAVKVLHPHLSRHPEVRERFRREGYAANRVEHPGAVKVLDDHVILDGPDAGTAYLVMELLDGESLQDRLERGPSIGEKEFLKIAASVLDVLQAAHARGVIHRDLKPENLFFVKDDGTMAAGAHVKVLDFGLARIQEGQAITSYGLALGTPSFMAPEQAAGRLDEIDGRTDLFALAATGFRLRTGLRIHEGANAVDLVRKMATLPAPRIRSIAADVSEPFARVVDRALEFRRENRYESAEAMRSDVERAIGELDSGSSAPTRVLSPSEIAVMDGPPTIEISARDLEPSQARVERGRSGRRRSVLPWVALALLGGIGAKLWFDARPSGGAPAPASSASARPAPAPASSELAASGGSEASVSANVAPQTPPSPPSLPSAPPVSPSASHHAAPSKTGPGAVPKLPRKRRAPHK
jgi:eukaryotic-like serine/threonine-protein kinase